MSPYGSENGDSLPRPGDHSRDPSADAPANLSVASSGIGDYVDARSDQAASQSQGSAPPPPPPALGSSPPKSPAAKPPLAPGGVRRGQSPLRKASNGDESEVSALSAVSEEDMQQQELAENQKTVTHRNLLPKGSHKRNVSWGVYDVPSSKGSAGSPSTGSVDLQQPDLTGTGGGRGGTMNGISGGAAAAPTGPLPPSLKPKRQVQRNKTVDSIISNLSPNPGHNRTNTRITLTDLTVSLYFKCALRA